MRDKLLAGASAGFAGAWVMTALIYMLNLFPGVSIQMINRLSTLYVVGTTGATGNQLIGIVAHLICGTVVGIGVFVVLDYFSFDHPLIKGIGAGLVVWFLLCGMLARFLNLHLADTFIDALLLMVIHIPFGITTVWLMHRWHLRQVI